MDKIKQFAIHAINHHKFTQEGDWKRGNKEIRKINEIYKSIKNAEVEEQEELLKLIYSDKPEISVLAATYSMRFSPDKCIAILKELSKKNIPHISFAAKQALLNWNNNEWYI